MDSPHILETWKALSPSRLHNLTRGVAFGLTDIGTVRAKNEDNFLIVEALELVMVADGMGGHSAGAVASAAALIAISQFLQQAALGSSKSVTTELDISGALIGRDPDETGSNPYSSAVALLNDAIRFANKELYSINLENERIQNGMGTTLTGFWHCATSGELVYFHVGDSRLYCYRDGILIQLTRDQTQYQQALDMGFIENLPARNLLLQAIGPTSDVIPEIRAFKAERNDVLMLCSDGLHGSVPHGEIEQALASVTESTLEQVCVRLIALAKEYGGRDNITVLLVMCNFPCIA